MLHTEQFFTNAACTFRIHDGQLPADHVFYDLVLVVLVPCIASDVFAIAHDGQTVGHFHDLCQLMCYEYNCNALFFQHTHDFEQALHVLSGKRGRWFIQD